MPTGELSDYVIKGLVAVAGTLLASVIIWTFRQYTRLRRIEEAYRELRNEKSGLTDRLEVAESAIDAWEARYERLKANDRAVREKFVVLRSAYLALRDKPPEPLPLPRDGIDVLTRDREQARQQAGDIRIEVDQLSQKLEDSEARIADMTRFDGRLWLREPTGAFPGFRPWADRKTTIISVLNLKGGVGKTTLTANLAATLAKPDSPALMIDLDYQRSLSMLLVGDKRRKELHGNRSSVQHFLRSSSHALADLIGRLEELAPTLPHCSVLTNSDSPLGGDAADSLEETENRLMVEWLFDRGRPDPRFFFREALHDPGLPFGYVLLDCPPRLTTACVNALAASDFVLIPTVPDSVSAHAVENLLWTLREFRDGLLPDLAVIGVVPNMLRLRLGEPVEAHRAALSELRDALTGVWPETVPIFKAGIKHDSAFGVSAAELDTTGKLRLAVSDAEVRESFQALAHELEKEIRRHASRRSTTVPAKPGVRARSGR